MTLPVALPSPPNGVSIARPSALVRFGGYLLTGITPEPQDTAAYLVVGANLLPWVGRVIFTALAIPPETSFVWLTNVQGVPVLTLLAVAQFAGFASQSRTARLLASTALASTALQAGTWLLLGPGDFAVSAYIAAGIHAFRAAIVGLWTARSIRSWFSE